MDAVLGRVEHYDRSQLLFQVREIVGDECYVRHGVQVGEGDVVLDVGANVGVAAVYFAAVRGAGAVHCFEPVAPLVELLRRNVANLPACVVHEYGLSSTDGEAGIVFYPRSAAMSGLYGDPERDLGVARTVLVNAGLSESDAFSRVADRYDAETLRCGLRRLSSFLSEGSVDRVDLLKIDVERAELDVLSGIDADDWRRIAQIVVEVHDEAGRGALVTRMLEERGFTVSDEQEPTMRGTDIRLLYAVHEATG
jgi:FkbM family methyltransferase